MIYGLIIHHLKSGSLIPGGVFRSITKGRFKMSEKYLNRLTELKMVVLILYLSEVILYYFLLLLAK